MHWVGWFITVALLLTVAVALNPVKPSEDFLPIWVAVVVFVVAFVVEVMRRNRGNDRD